MRSPVTVYCQHTEETLSFITHTYTDTHTHTGREQGGTQIPQKPDAREVCSRYNQT